MRPRRVVRPETEIAKPVVAYLRDLQWDVHQEVSFRSGRADIVAIQGKLVWVIEVKASLGMTVLAQARSWLGYAHLVSVAAPPARDIAYRICESLGIGALVSTGDVKCGRCVVRVAPHFQRRIIAGIVERLNDGTRTYAEAGNNANRFWSPFRDTCEQVLHVVLDRPGITTRGLIDAIRHHYATDASARGNLMVWARAGKIRGVVLDEHVRPCRWYPEHRAPHYAQQQALAI